MAHDIALMQPLLAALLASVRMVAFFTVYPLLHARVMSGPVKVAAVLSMGCLVMPLVYTQMPASIGWMQMAGVCIKEALLGTLMGYCAGILMWAAEGMGSLIDQQTGANMSAVIDPMTGQPGGPATTFIQQFIATLVLSSGAFLVLLGGIFDSYRMWPVFSPWPIPMSRMDALLSGEWRTLSELTLRLFAPVMLVLILVEMGLGLIQRYATSLDVFFLSQPIKQLLAVLMLTIVFSMIVDSLPDLIDQAGGLNVLLRFGKHP